jgi:hypothetical protein
MLACTYNYTLFNYWDIWLVDPLNNLFYVLAITFLIQRKLWPFAIVIILGSLNKETTLLLAPLYPILAWARTGSIKSHEVKQSLIAFVTMGVVYLTYHLWAQDRIGGHYALLSGQNGHSVWNNIRFALDSHKMNDQQLIYQVFQFVWLFFIYGLYRLYKKLGILNELLIISAYLFGAVMLGRLFASDTQRVYIMMAPIVMAVAALMFNSVKTEMDRLWVGVIAFLYVAVNLAWFTSPDFIMIANVGALAIFVLIFGARDLKLPKRSLFARV